MKTKDLEEGKIYQCKLSKTKMLIIESTKTIPGGGKDQNGKIIKDKKIKIKAGKYPVFDENDVLKGFAYDELYDGQLEEIKEKE